MRLRFRQEFGAGSGSTIGEHNNKNSALNPEP